MRKFLPLSLCGILVSLSILSSAQTDRFAYAITDVSKEGSSWKVLRKLNLKTGEYSSVVLDGMSENTFVVDAATKKQIALNNVAKDKQQQLPFNTGVAAIALDKKHNRLYFTPMLFNQLRYIELSSMKVYYVTDQAFSVNGQAQNGPGKIISRMVITPEGVGYAISNDGSDFIQFTTGKKTSIKNLGALIDDPANQSVSVHNSCTSYGGDILADDKGALYLFTGPNNIFKLNPETRVATYLGAIQGLPKDFTTNAAVVTEDGQILISSAVGKVSNYNLDLKTRKATALQTEELAYHTSDLANSNYISNKKKNPYTTIETIQSPKSSVMAAIQIYPNPIIEDSKFNIRFNNINAGKYILELIDLSGKPVLRKNLSVNTKSNFHTINFKGLTAKGLYLVRIVTANKTLVFEQKLMVQ